jgi:hypothetical protein
MLATFACDQVTANDRAAAAREAAAEQAAEQAEEKARADADEQEQRDLAIAAIEDGRGDPPRPLDDEEFEGILAYYCGDCHAKRSQPGPAAVAAGPVFDTTEDLIEQHRLTPGDAASSRVIERLREPERHPLQLDQPVVPPATIQLMADYIDSLPSE